jgi:2-polyprenyl-3-methyl-5-hydroxy-6-metoxy-1,4-benzoquinol methylase
MWLLSKKHVNSTEIHPGKIITTSNEYQIIDCEICKFIHIKPYPTMEDLTEIYQNEFYQNIKPNYIKKYEEELEYWKMIYHEKLEIIEQHVKDRKILDIGCGAGFFLKEAKNRKWDVMGVEPSSMAANYAKKNGIKVIEKMFEKVEINEKFNAIHLDAVLEHSISPNKVLQKCHSILDDNGIIIVEVPNDFNPLQKIVEEAYGKREWWIAPSEHLNYFTFQSIINLIEANGFEILLKDATFPLELFLLMGNDYVKDGEIGKEKHQERMRMELNFMKNNGLELKQKIYQKFADLEIGRRLIIYAKKIPVNQ